MTSSLYAFDTLSLVLIMIMKFSSLLTIKRNDISNQSLITLLIVESFLFSDWILTAYTAVGTWLVATGFLARTLERRSSDLCLTAQTAVGSGLVARGIFARTFGQHRDESFLFIVTFLAAQTAVGTCLVTRGIVARTFDL